MSYEEEDTCMSYGVVPSSVSTFPIVVVLGCVAKSCVAKSCVVKCCLLEAFVEGVAEANERIQYRFVGR